MIPVNSPVLGEKEKSKLIECIETGWISSEGPFVAEFEQKMASRVGKKYGIAVSSGTAALDIAIETLKLAPGDEVIVPSFTIISCIHQILRCGATPIFIDCDINSWNMTVEDVENAITPFTKAIMAVHIYGLPVDMLKLSALAEQHKIPIIEDTSQAIGLNCHSKPCGSFGAISTFSFYPNKHITTGEGGMLLTDCPDLAERAKSLRNLCFQKKQRFVHEELGWNYRMTNLQAALGIAQLEQLDEFIIRKKQIGVFYQTELANLDNLQKPLKKLDYAENIYWVFGLVVNQTNRHSAAEIMEALGQQGIGTRPFFWPLHLQPVLKQFGIQPKNALPNSELIAQNGFYLPSGLSLTDEQVEDVVSIVKKVIQ
ncbi:DegT/DnrJ/EryC1/StrS family aminotransferase [Aliikangiella sp. IMCC44359]|uniref:DegT/DnrJ/EryC1/StrS family aminotransferase n=1 Tax=Aliikangiella sp. IMCC44359 TaxID=3459125 RepID=UPI00403AB07B